MSPIIIKPRKLHKVCSVSRTTIGMVEAIVQQAKWTVNDRIQVGFIECVRCILLRRIKGEEGFKLAYANTRSQTGGKVECRAFITNYLQAVIELPKKNIAPVFLKNTDWTMALMLEPIKWERAEFSKTGVNTVPRDAIGVYELLGTGDVLLRVGEGKIKDRTNAHLADKRFTPSKVRAFRYVILDSTEDSRILEQIRIVEYEDETGILPMFQEIRA